jgi:ABC-type antimicrobial peptide transport system permease subunit
VIIVNEALVRRYLVGLDPVGLETDRGTIIGIAGDVRSAGLQRPSLPEIYFPMAQNVSQVRDLGMSLIISTHVQPSKTRAHPNLAIFGVKTMDEIVADSLSDSNFYTWLVGGFAVLALLMAAAGIYGVMSYAVSTRLREFGIRLALGQDSGSLQRLVFRHAAIMIAVGLGIGLCGVFVSARFLESLIAGAGSVQPLHLGAAAVLLAGIGLIAAFVPARRAARVDPIHALRHEN